MSEHAYPQHLPKDSEVSSIRAAWAILDSVRPTAINNIARFHLAEQIVARLEITDNVIAAAGELADHMGVMSFDLLAKLDAELAHKIMTLQMAVARYRGAL